MNTPINQLVGKQNVVFLQTSDSCAYALSTLDKHNITSCPVIGENKKIYGFLDILDLVIYLTRVASKPKHSNVTPESISLSTDDMGMIAQRSADFNLSHVSDAIDLSKRNPYFPLHEAQDLNAAVSIFLKGPHRIAVTNSSNQIINILTQSNVLQWLAADPSRIGIRADKFATDIMKPFTAIEPSTKVIDAFQMIVDKGVTALAVVQNDVLVGSLSATDLKSLREFRFLKLLDNVGDFLAAIRREKGKPDDYIVVCSENFQLKDIIKRMNHEHVHRIYVVDGSRKPLGVINISDILFECFTP